MKPLFRPALAFLALACLATPGRADEEASNLPQVFASTYGRCYARSLPAEVWGQKGETTVHEVKAEGDRLLARYPWYSDRIRLQCNLGRNGRAGVSLVRFGPWQRGHEASPDHLALAFYFNEELLARYSTLEIAGSPEGVEHSVSHYVVIREIHGYRWIEGDTTHFEITTVDGRKLAFDPVTGRRPAN